MYGYVLNNTNCSGINGLWCERFPWVGADIWYQARLGNKFLTNVCTYVSSLAEPDPDSIRSVDPDSGSRGKKVEKIR